MVSPDVAKYNLHPYAIIVLPIPFALLSSIAISIRIWIRCCLARSFGRDDVCLIIAHICFLAACGVFIAIGVTEYREGLHPIVKLAELSIIGIVLYLLNQCFFKLSMAFFFLRIHTCRLHRWIVILSVTTSIICNLMILSVSIAQCGNIGKIDISNPQCLSWDILGPLNYLCATLNATVDWILALLAIHIVRGLNMDARSKASVYAIIVLASAGSIVSVVRIPYIPGLRVDRMYYSRENDVIAYTSLIESSIGIIVASMSVMRPLAARLAQKAKIALSSNSSSGRSKPRPKNSSRRQLCPDDIEIPKAEGKGAEVKLYQAIPDPTPTYTEAESDSGIDTDYLTSKSTMDLEKGEKEGKGNRDGV